jgi:nitrogen fixation protein NifX
LCGMDFEGVDENIHAIKENYMQKEHVNVAFATNNLEQVDTKFEAAGQLAIYEVSHDSSRLIKAVQFGDSGDVDEQLTARCNALQGCAVLFVYGTPLGAVAAFHMVNNKVFAIKLQTIEPIPGVIGGLQELINNSPPLWLSKALKAGSESKNIYAEAA